ncbi:flavodoxin [Slackia equolifaciens]|uniref:Flavodoxin n=2 Tax=Slackia equolifaciens TaxID=498718 RepID=A0A3N0B518_9ACTN|nr:flavodoxin [Slackia equolifaciens]
MTAFLDSCASSDNGTPDITGQEGQDASSEADSAQEQQAAPEEQTSDSSGRILVAYFSASGNTEGIAQAIADELGADVFFIEPTDPYTEEDLGYNNSDSRTSRERDDPNRSIELERIVPDGFDSYDTVFLGYPIWWGNASWVMDNFVSGNDFTGKTVIPFCTSGSSPIGSSAEDLAAMAGTGEWLEGRRFGAGAGKRALLREKCGKARKA